MSELIESIERRQSRTELPRLRMGDRVRVHFQVVEGTRRRTQVFEGVVMKLQGAGLRRTFTVRKISFGVGVERTFPLHSPKVERVELMARGEVRRAKLYYLRGRVGRRARIRERRDIPPEELGIAAPQADEGAAADVSADGADSAGPSEEETTAEGEAPDVAAEAEGESTAAEATEETEETEAAAPEESAAPAEQATEVEEPPAAEREAEADQPADSEQEPAQTGEKS
jgi:large subunit ribosomal protein L19